MRKNMVVLIDANVILDYVASREPYYHDVKKVIGMCYSGEIDAYMAFHSVSVIWYVLRKFISDESERRTWMRKILQIIHVTGASHEAVVQAVDMDFFRDFEDCLQDRCAEAVNARYIITNNVKDFEKSTVVAIRPDDFCKRMNVMEEK